MERRQNVKLRSVLIGLGICLLAVAYVAISTKGAFRFSEAPGFLTYDMPAEAFLSGRLSLDIPVPRGRLEAKDPTDPELPYPRLHDAIIADGKYWFTFEPFPALFHAVWIGITGLKCPTGAMIALFALGAVIWLGVILVDFRNSFFPQTPLWPAYLLLISFALSGPQLHLAARPVVYHEAIAAGGFFVLGGAACFLKFLTANNRRFLWIGLSGCLFSAAIASRALLVFYPLCFAAGLFVYLLREKATSKQWLMTPVLFSAPVFVAVIILFAYNYARFGDWLDFGRSHICTWPPLIHYYICTVGFNHRLAHVLPNVYTYTASLPDFVSHMPYMIHPSGGYSDGNVLIVRERVSSVFIIAPILILAVASPLIPLIRTDSLKLRIFLVSCILSAGATFFVLTTFYRAATRYLYDFTPILFVAAFYTAVVLLERRADGKRGGTVVKALIAALAVAAILSGMVMAYTGMWLPH